MWAAIRRIEDHAKTIAPVKGNGRIELLTDCNEIKRLIQTEVGQLE